AFSHVYGMEVWEYRAQHAEANARFNAFQASRSADMVEAVGASYDFSGFGVAVDVGGGYGVLLSRLLRANQDMRGILFDFPKVVEGARAGWRRRACWIGARSSAVTCWRACLQAVTYTFSRGSSMTATTNAP
ncbi:MAG TPA: methyltransferase, partial [Dehalococcoidia bacterium]|nr:methyltransferase [Dehalococcoidia bacterium]